MEKPCRECGIVAMIDDEAKICYDCFSQMDLRVHEEESKKGSAGILIPGMPVTILEEE